MPALGNGEGRGSGLVNCPVVWKPQAEVEIAHITTRVPAGEGHHIQTASIKGKD